MAAFVWATQLFPAGRPFISIGVSERLLVLLELPLEFGKSLADCLDDVVTFL
jgi:hypothetical protein